MTSRVGKMLAAVLVASGAMGAFALAAGSGAPKTRSGKSAQLVASNVATPTSFAFGDKQVFMSDGTPPPEAPVGGVYVIKHGAPVKLPGSPPLSFGVTFHKGTLYVSAVDKILAWSGWNGAAFAKQKTIYTAPKGFTGFNGLAFGADGRLYAGVSLSQTNDHSAPTTPFEYDVLSMTATGKHVKVFARGMRQPWQLAFPGKSSTPFISDLGQESGAKNPPDFIMRAKKGSNFGFPKCNWTKPSACRGYAKPFKMFSPHTDAMGLGIIGKRLYISEFGGSTPARVVSTPVRGGRTRVELSGFPKGRNIVGLGVHNGWVYVGEIAASPKELGAVYRFKP